LRKLTTTEMDNNFENIVNAIADAGLSPTMPEGQIYIGDNTNTASLETLDKTLVGLDNVDNTSDANKPISIAQMASNSTGVKTGGVLSIGTGGAGVATTFTIASGEGLVVDNTVNPATLLTVTWSSQTNISVTNIGTQPLTFVAIDSSGNVIQQATDFNGLQHRQYIVIGTVIHTNLTTVTAVNQGQHLSISPQSQLNDLFQSLAGFNISGNIFSANGANLSLNKSAGEIFKQGANYSTSANNPNIVTMASLTVAPFRYNNQTGNASASLTSIDPDNYDLAGVTTLVPSNKFTIQRIFLFSSNLLAIQRGQALYNSLAEAKASIQTESFIVNSSIIPNGILRGFLVVQQGTTALNSVTKAFFLEAPKFGGTAGVGGLSVSTLQNAYDNSTSPEILTDTTRGALSVKRGTASNTDTVFDVQNGAGTETFSVDGNGTIFSNSLTASTLAFINASKQIITATGALIGTFLNGFTAKSTVVDADIITTLDSASSFEAKKTTLLQLWSNYLLVKVQALGYLSGSLTTNIIPKSNGTSLINSNITDSGSVVNVGSNIALGVTANGLGANWVYFKDINTTSKTIIRVDANNVSSPTFSIDYDYTNSRSTFNFGQVYGVDFLNPASRLMVRLGGSFATNLFVQADEVTGLRAFGVYHAITDTYVQEISATGIITSRSKATSNTDVIHRFDVKGGGARAIFYNGGLAIGASAINASSELELQSTTKGFLPNRMTNAQRTAITSPAIGLMVYCTDATEGLYIYKSTGWTFII